MFGVVLLPHSASRTPRQPSAEIDQSTPALLKLWSRGAQDPSPVAILPVECIAASKELAVGACLLHNLGVPSAHIFAALGE